MRDAVGTLRSFDLPPLRLAKSINELILCFPGVFGMMFSYGFLPFHDPQKIRQKPFAFHGEDGLGMELYPEDRIILMP